MFKKQLWTVIMNLVLSLETTISYRDKGIYQLKTLYITC